MSCIPTCFLATKSSVINDPSFVCIVGSIKGNHLRLLHYIWLGVSVVECSICQVVFDQLGFLLQSLSANSLSTIYIFVLPLCLKVWQVVSSCLSSWYSYIIVLWHPSSAHFVNYTLDNRKYIDMQFLSNFDKTSQKNLFIRFFRDTYNTCKLTRSCNFGTN